MIRKLICLMTAVLYLFALSCTSEKVVKPTKVRPETDHIIALVLTTGEVIRFDKNGGRLDEAGLEIRGWTEQGEPVKAPIADVMSATVERTSTAAILIPIVMVVGFIILIAATSDDGGSSNTSSSSSGSSCPYVYSFDGARYILDAEPLSGAITRGLERDDLCRLENLKPVDDHYELLVRNELEETQFIDRMQLRIAGHPAGSSVHTDINGTLHTIANEVPPATARDETGMDMRAVLAEPDNITWQSQMPADDSWRDVALRHEMQFTFARPAGKTAANLVVGASTSLWGSIMMREMMQARGANLTRWRADVDANGSAMAEMIQFNMREELYFLKVYIREGDAWVERGLIPGGGPMATETRVIPLDLSGVSGDTVTLRIAPPRGYWAFDYLAMSYDELAPPRITTVPLRRAAVANGDDATASLAEADGAYFEMRDVGDAAVLTFDAPAVAEDGEQTIFLDARGYYHSHIDASQPEQTELIAEMLNNDGAIVRYSLQKFAEFAGQRATR